MHIITNMRENPYQKQGLIDLCDWLNERINTKYASLLEIGCYQGESSEIFAQYFKHITCIDIWENIDGLMDDVTKQYPMKYVEENFNKRMSNYHNISKVKGAYENVFLHYLYDQSHDVVYIDANHEYIQVKADIVKALVEEVPAFISGHDYTEGWPGVIQAVDEVFGKPTATFQDGSWVVDLRHNKTVKGNGNFKSN